MTQEQVMVPVQQIQGNPWNRKVFSDDGLRDLSESIKARGVLEPLIVRKLQEGKFEIASGERRWKAALLAGCQDVPCLIQELKDEDVQDMNLICNVQREDISALEKAAMIKARMESGKLSQKQMASRMGKSEIWLCHLLQLLDMPPQVRASLAKFSLPSRPMQAIAGLPNADYQQQIAQELAEGKIKPEQVEHRVHQLHNGYKAGRARKRNAEGQNRTAEVPGTADQPGTADLSRTADQARKADLPKAAGVAGGTSTREILTALKDDVADNYLPSFGKVGGVMRTSLDHAWNGPKKHLMTWGVTFTVLSFLWIPVQKVIHYAFTRVMHLEVNQVINKNTVPQIASAGAAFGETPHALTLAMLAKVAAPTAFKAELLSGQKIRFIWNPVPGCAGYNFYSARAWERQYKLENKMPLTATTAVWRSDTGPDDFKFVVTAVDSQDHESAYSNLVDVDLR